MKIVTYLRQVYPFYYENLRSIFLILCCLAGISFLFIFLFEPFNVNVSEHKISSLGVIALHSLIPVPIAFLYVFVLNKTVKNIENWTLGKELLHLLLILLLIGLGNFFIRDFVYTNPDNWSFRYLWEEIRNTFLVGGLILTIILPLNLERLINKHVSFLEKLPASQNINNPFSTVKIHTPILNEEFELDLHSFLFAKVDSNYLEIFYRGSNGFDMVLKRLTLKEFYDQVRSFKFILQVHRSYVVNLKAITSISGNAQGYVLSINNYTKGTIPVSRANIETFNRLYKNLSCK